MNRIVFIAVLCISICGCGRQSTYGNFLGEPAVGLVDDALYELSQVYPPAKYRFRVIHETDDAFGTALITKMREYGYGVSEAGQVGASDESDGLLDFAYVIDEYPKEKEVRLVLKVGNQMLSRLYSSPAYGEGEYFEPLGNWVWRQ